MCNLLMNSMYLNLLIYIFAFVIIILAVACCLNFILLSLFISGRSLRCEEALDAKALSSIRHHLLLLLMFSNLDTFVFLLQLQLH